MIHRLRPSIALGRPARRKHAIFLMVAFLFAQYVLIAHQIGHQLKATDAACDICLTAQHLGSTPISKDTLSVCVNARESIIFSPITGLLSPQISTGFSARAPPFFSTFNT